MEFQFPYGMRPTRTENRQKFYEKEFSLKALEEWFNLKDKGIIVVDIGADTTRYKHSLKDKLGKLIHLKNYKNLEQLQEKIRNYIPEDIYYLTKFQEGLKLKQELIIDLDPKKLIIFPHLKNTSKGNVFSFSQRQFIETTSATQELYEILKRHFQHIRVVFSGRSYHLHIRDKSAFEYTDLERLNLSKELIKRFPIDERTTSGKRDFVRLPGSLNGITSRIAVEIKKRDLNDPERIVNELSLPKFLKN